MERGVRGRSCVPVWLGTCWAIWRSCNWVGVLHLNSTVLKKWSDEMNMPNRSSVSCREVRGENNLDQLVLLISYYRQDINLPNQRSFKKQKSSRKRRCSFPRLSLSVGMVKVVCSIFLKLIFDLFQGWRAKHRQSLENVPESRSSPGYCGNQPVLF